MKQEPNPSSVSAIRNREWRARRKAAVEAREVYAVLLAWDAVLSQRIGRDLDERDDVRHELQALRCAIERLGIDE